MTDNMIELAKRAVACRGWRWMPGMLYRYREESDEVTVPTKHYWCDPTRVRDHDPDVPACFGGLSIPDLTDPATLGCLLALVREAHHEPTYLPTCLDAHDEAWVIESPAQKRQTRYGSYASVLVAALEAAP